MHFVVCNIALISFVFVSIVDYVAFAVGLCWLKNYHPSIGKKSYKNSWTRSLGMMGRSLYMDLMLLF